MVHQSQIWMPPIVHIECEKQLAYFLPIALLFGTKDFRFGMINPIHQTPVTFSSGVMQARLAHGGKHSATIKTTVIASSQMSVLLQYWISHSIWLHILLNVVWSGLYTAYDSIPSSVDNLSPDRIWHIMQKTSRVFTAQRPVLSPWRLPLERIAEKSRAPVVRLSDLYLQETAAAAVPYGLGSDLRQLVWRWVVAAGKLLFSLLRVCGSFQF